MTSHLTYLEIIWAQFKKRRLGMVSFYILIAFCLAGIYAPLLASSKPLFVIFDGKAYFPLFRYLFYPHFYTKWLDVFFNLMMFTLPLFIIASRWRIKGFCIVLLLQITLFTAILFKTPVDPANTSQLAEKKQAFVQKGGVMTWQDELSFMNDYAKLNLVLHSFLGQKQDVNLREKINNDSQYATVWQLEQREESEDKKELTKRLKTADEASAKSLQLKLNYLTDRRLWINEQISHLHMLVMPLIRPFHWEDDAGGEQSLNAVVPWWDLTRINRKDLTAALIFGIRISLVVGTLSVGLALAVGIPIGAFAGYYGGTFDIIVSRLLEIWESMPTFFMLLLVVSILQTKSIFLVIAVIGIFGWTGFSRYVRGETFKQKNLPYVEACKAIGFSNMHIVFSEILPNAIAPVLTLLPFAIMGAITAEAGLSFLGLGEEASASWGVLMDEGRTAFPGESYLLWPPAILLTLLLVVIALIGDALRDAIDPKMSR